MGKTEITDIDRAKYVREQAEGRAQRTLLHHLGRAIDGGLDSDCAGEVRNIITDTIDAGAEAAAALILERTGLKSFADLASLVRLAPGLSPVAPAPPPTQGNRRDEPTEETEFADEDPDDDEEDDGWIHAMIGRLRAEFVGANTDPTQGSTSEAEDAEHVESAIAAGIRSEHDMHLVLTMLGWPRGGARWSRVMDGEPEDDDLPAGLEPPC